MATKGKRKLLAALAILLSVLFLQNCKHDPAPVHSSATDPDSLYVGRPYVMPIIPSYRYGYKNIVSPADNPMTYEGIQLGRMLFYDSTLSLTRRVSCGSCHKQQYAFGDNQKLSQNVLGSTVRNTPPLINMGMNVAFFLDGRQPNVEDALNDALNHEMHPDFVADINYLSSVPKYSYLFKKAFGRPGNITENKIIFAIAQFVRTLTSTNSLIDRYYRGEINIANTPAGAGLDSFFSPTGGDCFHCHSGGFYLTFASQDPSAIYSNNAIDSVPSVFDFVDKGRGAITGDTNDNGKFKVPTLRNVAVSGPYMHDGRYTTLQQVIGHYSDSLKYSPNVDVINLQHFPERGLHIDSAGKANLLAFLNALTDTTFLHNPAFSNPFH
jgi:cytochrome c peroxidase